MPNPASVPPPSLHAFRHPFAVNRLRLWYEAGGEVQTHLPHLCVYLGPLLPYFFVDYLCTQKPVSPHAIASYRDTLRLLLEFLRDTTGMAPAAARIADLQVAQSLAFSSTQSTGLPGS